MAESKKDNRLRLLTLKQVMARLECSDATVRRLVAAGRMAAGVRHTPDTPPRWFEDDVETYLHRLARGEFRDEPLPELPKKGDKSETGSVGESARNRPK